MSACQCVVAARPAAYSLLVLMLLAFRLETTRTTAFQVTPSPWHSSGSIQSINGNINSSSSKSSRQVRRVSIFTRLSAKKRKRGKLGDVDIATASPNSPSKSSSKTKTTSSGNTSTARIKPMKARTNTQSQPQAVSPALAEWASQSPSSGDTGETTGAAAEEAEAVVVQSKSNKPKKTLPSSSRRRVKQSERIRLEQENNAFVLQIIDTINNVLENKKSKSLDDILSSIRPLLTCDSANLRQLTLKGGSTGSGGDIRSSSTAASAPSEATTTATAACYRLAWVGSDDSLTHIGTGLHKVPLARMQEVFLLLPGKGRVLLYEVIRVLGPFPNVRNTLQGDSRCTSCTTAKKDNDNDTSTGMDVTEWNIVYDSMLDGTGKELLAATQDSVRNVKLHVYFADANAILAVVPPPPEKETTVQKSLGAASANAKVKETTQLWDDPLQDNGVNALLFVREEELDSKLEMMRVS